jgi:hypothetical protein
MKEVIGEVMGLVIWHLVWILVPLSTSIEEKYAWQMGDIQINSFLSVELPVQ